MPHSDTVHGLFDHKVRRSPHVHKLNRKSDHQHNQTNDHSAAHSSVPGQDMRFEMIFPQALTPSCRKHIELQRLGQGRKACSHRYGIYCCNYDFRMLTTSRTRRHNYIQKLQGHKVNPLTQQGNNTSPPRTPGTHYRLRGYGKHLHTCDRKTAPHYITGHKKHRWRQ